MSASSEPSPIVRPRLRKLVIHQYANVRPGTTLEFDDTWNLLVGKNGAGKTTLLRLIEMVLGGYYETPHRRHLHAEFEVELRGGLYSGEVKRVEGLEWTLRHEGMEWRATQENAEDGISTSGEASLLRDLRRSGLLLPRLYPRLGRFDEALGTFMLLTFTGSVRRTVTPRGDGYGGPQLVSELLDRHARRLHDIVWTDDVALREFIRGADIEWTDDDDDVALQEFIRHAGFDSARVVAQTSSATTEEANLELQYKPPSFTFSRSWTRASARVSHADLSFGQKRLLAFLYYLEAHPDFVLVDELSNGMHRDWLDALVESMASRQVFAATQNPLLVDRIPFEDDARLARSFIHCSVDDEGYFVWKRPDDEAMREVLASKETGLSSLSEILWNGGLW